MEYKILSSMGDKEYTVTEDGDDWFCNCPAGISGKLCRHIRKARTPQMEINTAFIKFSSSLNEVQPDELPEIDEEVQIIVQGVVVKKEKRSNNDGTFDLIAVVKPWAISLGKE